MTSANGSAHFRAGVDIGGTFTDIVIVDEGTGAIRVGKVLSTPRDPSQAFARSVERILQLSGSRPTDVGLLIHATTVATNAIIEGKGARTALITTEGFRDLLEIQRQIRPVLYDVKFEKPPPLLPRNLVFEVPERLDFRGQVLLALDEDAVRARADELAKTGIEAVAVCLLHSYGNADHEERVARIMRQRLPGVTVTRSSEVAPQIREYARATTTVVNALIQPVVQRYLEAIEQRLRNQGIEAQLLLMQSNGGVAAAAAAAESPVNLLESGPAAGTIAAADLGKQLGWLDVITFDMGGTTAKAALVRGGRPQVTREYEVGSSAGARMGSGRGSGYPINTPVIDLVEIGAGGGSIAWIDSGGVLRVGPHSAGADPGPACYGLGGEAPTVTDANLVLGRLDPDYFLGGDMRLDVERARRAIDSHCAEPLGMEVVEAASGIVEIANASMVDAIRLVSVQRGHDPREFSLIGFGGAGPVHVNRLAIEMGAPLAIIPPSPGTFSALGLLVTDLRHEVTRAYPHPVASLCWEDLAAAYEGMVEEGRALLRRDGVTEGAMEFVREVDMRYIGQSYELTVGLPGDVIGASDAALHAFHAEHERSYGFCSPAEPTEMVHIRVLALGRISRPVSTELAPGGAPAPDRTRQVYFAEVGGMTDCPIYLRHQLGAGAVLEGPAIIEEADSTTVLHPGYRVTVDSRGSLLMRPAVGN